MLCLGTIASQAQGTDISKLDNILYIEPFTTNSGEEVYLSIKMKNTNFAATGYQVDISLPEGMEFVMDDEFYMADLSLVRTTKAKTNYFDCAESPDNPGMLRLLCNSTKGYAFGGTDGEVATVQVRVKDDMASGTYAITLYEIELSEATGFKGIRTETPIVCEFTNAGKTAPVQCEAPVIEYKNGEVLFSCPTEGVTYNMSSTTTVSGKLEGASKSVPLSITVSVYASKEGYEDSETVSKTFAVADFAGPKGDVNADGTVNISDVTALVNIILKK